MHLVQIGSEEEEEAEVCTDNKAIPSLALSFELGLGMAIYDKYKISTKERITKGDKKCTKLRQHILKEYQDVFKDRLDKTDRLNINPVHLEIDQTCNITPYHAAKAYGIPYHLRKPVKAEFVEMLRSGVLTETREAGAGAHSHFRFRSTIAIQ